MLSADLIAFLRPLSLETLVIVKEELYKEQFDELYKEQFDELEVHRYEVYQKIRAILAGYQHNPPHSHHKFVLMEDAAANHNLQPIGYLAYMRSVRQSQQDRMQFLEDMLDADVEPSDFDLSWLETV